MDHRFMPGAQVLRVTVYAPARRSAAISFAVLPFGENYCTHHFFETFLPIFLQVSK